MRPERRRPRATSTRCRQGSSIASWCAHCKGWRNTTWPRSGPRRWNAGPTPTPSAASAAGAGCIVPRSCGCGDAATRPRPRRSGRATSFGPTFAASSDGRSANSAASGCTAATSPPPSKHSWQPTRPAGTPNRDSHGALRTGRHRRRRSVDQRRARPPFVGAVQGAPPSTDLRRAPLLDAQVEIAIAAGDLDEAQASPATSSTPSPPGSGARRWPPSRRKAEHACNSPHGDAMTPNAVLRGGPPLERSREHPTKPRSPASASPMRTAPSAPTNAPTSKQQRRRRHPRSDHDRRVTPTPRPRSPPAAGREQAPPAHTTRSAAEATTGR